MPPFGGQKQSLSSGSSGTLRTCFPRFPWDSPSEYGTASCQLPQLKSYLTAAFCLKQRNTLLFVWYQFYLLRQPRQFSVWARQALPPAAQGTCKSSPVSSTTPSQTSRHPTHHHRSSSTTQSSANHFQPWIFTGQFNCECSGAAATIKSLLVWVSCQPWAVAQHHPGKQIKYLPSIHSISWTNTSTIFN